MPDLLQYDFMQRALLAALLVGLTAPLVGVFLVQRRLSLIGDGIGHVALAGVAIGVLTGHQPVLTALVVAALAAVAIEVIRMRGGASGDVVLAIMFYGGIALGVVLMARAPAGGASLNSDLFGAITTTSPAARPRGTPRSLRTRTTGTDSEVISSATTRGSVITAKNASTRSTT